MSAHLESCPHADSTTIAWIYGEGPEDHALHVSACAVCSAVLEEHERVVAAVVGTEPMSTAQADSASVTPANNTVWYLAAGVAAAMLVGLFLMWSPDTSEPVAVETPEPSTPPPVLDEVPPTMKGVQPSSEAPVIGAERPEEPGIEVAEDQPDIEPESAEEDATYASLDDLMDDELDDLIDEFNDFELSLATL